MKVKLYKLRLLLNSNTYFTNRFSMKFLALCTITISFKRKRIDCKSFIAKPDGQLI